MEMSLHQSTYILMVTYSCELQILTTEYLSPENYISLFLTNSLLVEKFKGSTLLISKPSTAPHPKSIQSGSHRHNLLSQDPL